MVRNGGGYARRSWHTLGCNLGERPDDDPSEEHGNGIGHLRGAPVVRTVGLRAGSKTHTVTLIWKASKSAVRGYNVYRGTESGGPYMKINRALVQGLTYKDENVPGGTTYYYVTRSIDADDRESVNSSEITVNVP